VTPLEALAVDYVKLHDRLEQAFTQPTEGKTHQELAEISKQVGDVAREKDMMLAALRSHVRAAYTKELNQ
jgi:hypothetical protein